MKVTENSSLFISLFLRTPKCDSSMARRCISTSSSPWKKSSSAMERRSSGPLYPSTSVPARGSYAALRRNIYIVGQRENVFFSRPAVKPSDDEKVALSEFIKGRHSSPSMFLTSKRLTCLRCPSMGRVSMKVYANGYGKYYRMECLARMVIRAPIRSERQSCGYQV